MYTQVYILIFVLYYCVVVKIFTCQISIFWCILGCAACLYAPLVYQLRYSNVTFIFLTFLITFNGFCLFGNAIEGGLSLFRQVLLAKHVTFPVAQTFNLLGHVMIALNDCDAAALS